MHGFALARSHRPDRLGRVVVGAGFAPIVVHLGKIHLKADARPMTPSETFDPEALLAIAVAHIDDEDTSAAGEARDDPAWDAISELQRSGSQILLGLCDDLCVSTDPRARRVGAAVLGQLGVTDGRAGTIYAEERFQALHGLLLAEIAGPATDRVLADVCIALGHLHDPRTIPAIAGLSRHHDGDVRYAVAHGLSGHEDSCAVDALIKLSGDAEARVRDWATFGLGQLIKSDTPAIRAAFRGRLDDPDIDARNEAIEGLATRGDRSVLPTLVRELNHQVSVLLLDAAIALATPELCDALAAAAEKGLVWEAKGQRHDLTQHWSEARRACGCDVRQVANEVCLDQ